MNLQLMISALIVAGLVLSSCERERHLTAEIDRYQAQIVELSAAYKQRLLDQQREYEALQNESYARLSELTDLRSSAERLRAELAAANKRAAALSHSQDRSQSAAVDPSRRVAALETALNRASDLITERDQCAINYNALKRQCTAQDGGKDGRLIRGSQP